MITRQQKKTKNNYITEPKERLESLLVLTTLLIGYYFLYVYQNMLHIKVKLISFQTLIQMPIMVLIIIPLIHYLIIKPDCLQRSPCKKKPIRFFQNEFPSKYLLERCERCIENETSCPNYIKAQSYAHIRYWFNELFHGVIERENPKLVKDTYEKGYSCKLIYYLTWILAIFSGLGIVIILFYHLYLYFSGNIKIELTALQIFYPLVCIVIIILIRALNRPDENRPSGYWQAWQEINRIHVSWLKSNEEFLVHLICQANGAKKRFKQK